MRKSTIQFMGKQDFAALSLHEKNEYLQKVTKAYMDEKGDEFTPLNKDALSRLRRFYARRSFADLQLENIDDHAMQGALKRMSEAIHGKVFGKVLESEILPSASADRLNRAPPIGDDQLMFFVPDVHDAPLKDEVNLMDVAPFALSKVKKDGVIRYELKDCVVTVEGGSEVGIANAYDYDIFLNMVTYLAEEMRKFKASEKRGVMQSLPEQMYRPTASQILKFCRRGQGGKQYLELEKALDRLQATRIKITNIDDGKRREAESFPLIGRYKVVSRSSKDKIDQVEIDIPKWVYQGVVKPDGKPSILTLSPDYFLIAKPTARFLYRLARKAAGTGEAFYKISDVHYRSGSALPLRKFRNALKEIVEASKTDPLPDYDFELRKGKEDLVLYMKRREVLTDQAGQHELL